MKKVTLIIFLTFCIKHQASGQKLFKEKYYYVQDTNGELHKISKKEARLLIEKYHESKSLYKTVKTSNDITTGSFLVAIPAISFYLLNWAETKQYYNYSGYPWNHESMELYEPICVVGSVLTVSGIVSSILSKLTLQKAISVYNEKAGYKRPESFSLTLSASPGNLALKYQF